MKRFGMAAALLMLATTAQAQTDCPAGVATAVTPAQIG